MKFKVFKKLFFTTSCVLFITLTLVFVLLSIAINDEFAKNKYQILNNSCDIISHELSADIPIISDDLETLVKLLSDVNQLDIYIVDRNGRIFCCGCDIFNANGNCIHTNTILNSEFLKHITIDGRVELSSVDGLYERMNYTSTKKINIGADSFCYVIAVSRAMTATELIKIMFGMYAVSAILPLVFMFIAEYSIVYRLTRPLKYMSIAAKSIAQGDFSKRVPVMSNDEIGELSILFNRMSDSLSRSEMTGKSFVANISHELKTPMTTISGFIDGIIDGTIDDSKKEYYLQIVSNEVKRLSRLVQSMLSLARLESSDISLKESSFRLSEIILNVAISMEHRITEKNINIVGLDSLTETVIQGDMDLLYQVVYNLTDNAVKFTQNNGIIEFHLHRINDALELKIKNTGEGISQKDLPHIFERFYKTDKSRSDYKNSLGLGLYICKTIVELHGGTILVNAEHGEFTEFTVRLPLNYNERR